MVGSQFVSTGRMLYCVLSEAARMASVVEFQSLEDEAYRRETGFGLGLWNGDAVCGEG